MNKIFVLLLIFGLLSGCQLVNEKQQSTTVNGIENKVIAGLDELNNKIRNDSLNPDLYHERSKFYLENNELNGALKDLLTALQLDSNYAGYYVTISDVYLAMGKLQKTVESLERAIELDNKHVDAYLKLAEISMVIHDYKKALAYIDLALKTDDLAAKGYLLRGVVMIENGDTLRAVRNFQKAIDVQQNYIDAHLQLAILYASEKNDIAIDYFNNALNIEPSNIDIMYYLAMYYQETGRFDKAIQAYNSILDLDPGFFLARYNIGYINLVYFEKFEEAINDFTETIRINPEYPEAWYNRGLSYELLKNVEYSRKDYEKTLELSANYQKAIDGLNRIDQYLEEGGTSSILLRKASKSDNP